MSDPIEVQRLLQIEADAVVRDLQLEELLEPIGQPIRVGSSAMGLMVRRDIDITVVCARLDAGALAEFAAVGARLMQQTAMVEGVRFRNDSGKWNREPENYPDGLYLNLLVRGRDGAAWTLDIWLVDQPERQPDLAHLRTLLPRLTDDHRRVILAIKHVLAGRPDSGPSALVYEAVVDNGIETVEQFEAWRLRTAAP
jgi:hypothetical protein